MQSEQHLPVSKLVIVGAGVAAAEIEKLLNDESYWGLKVVKRIDVQGSTEALVSEISHTIDYAGADKIIFAVDPNQDPHIKQAIYSLQEHPVSIYVLPDYFELAFLRMGVENLGPLSLVSLKAPVMEPFERAVKRIFDILCVSLLLIPALPLMLVIAVAIALDSPGPVLFFQERVGESRRRFRMYKFRSMAADAEAQFKDVAVTTPEGATIYKRPDDPRITRIGRLLRRTSLDELPQLFNILRGDMSLVGPRPELPLMVSQYEPWQRKRFEVPQGLTGWWQINGRADRAMHLNTEQDLYYIQNYSIWLDIQILLRTIGVVLTGRGAY